MTFVAVFLASSSISFDFNPPSKMNHVFLNSPDFIIPSISSGFVRCFLLWFIILKSVMKTKSSILFTMNKTSCNVP